MEHPNDDRSTETIAKRLTAARPSPSPRFQVALRSHLAAFAAKREATRTPTVISALAGALLLLLAVGGILGLGPLAA